MQRARTAYRDTTRALIALGLVLGLAACDGLEGNAGGGFDFAPRQSAPRANAAAVTRTELLGGAIVVPAPPGYCVDAGSLRRGAGFALIASCWNLTDGQSGNPVEPAILTLSAVNVPAGSTLPDAATLAALVDGGTPSEVRESETLTLIRLDDGGQDGVTGGDPRHWRGAMMLGGRIVLLAAYAPRGGAATGGLGADLLAELAANVQRDSPGEAAPRVGAAPDLPVQEIAGRPDTAPEAEAEAGQAPGLGAAFRRLYN
ncbi:hypothetical protein [Mesobacterium pallidum]|uniref:hypothetical protein n=1 Tax=Mesobacterium pallidum TaxID=2872037 RepID=UPI001EE29848|nr:hypothetical protein [Mesobacterium pallidum]